MDIKDFIRIRREELKLSMGDLADLCGVSKATISRWESGDIENMKRDKIKALADALRIKPSLLINNSIEDQVVNLPHITRIPLYASISCGTGMFVDDNIEDYIAVPDKYIKPNHEYFANTACGDSMIGKGIKNGDVLVFERTNAIDNGEIGAFCINDDTAVCKTFRRLSNGMVMLESANDNYEPIMVDLSDGDDCLRIIGRYKFKFSIEQ